MKKNFFTAVAIMGISMMMLTACGESREKTKEDEGEKTEQTESAKPENDTIKIKADNGVEFEMYKPFREQYDKNAAMSYYYLTDTAYIMVNPTYEPLYGCIYSNELDARNRFDGISKNILSASDGKAKVELIDESGFGNGDCGIYCLKAKVEYDEDCKEVFAIPVAGKTTTLAINIIDKGNHRVGVIAEYVSDDEIAETAANLIAMTMHIDEFGEYETMARTYEDDCLSISIDEDMAFWNDEDYFSYTMVSYKIDNKDEYKQLTIQGIEPEFIEGDFFDYLEASKEEIKEILVDRGLEDEVEYEDITIGNYDYKRVKYSLVGPNGDVYKDSAFFLEKDGMYYEVGTESFSDEAEAELLDVLATLEIK